MKQGDVLSLPKGWEIRMLGEILVKTQMVDPTKEPDKEFTYLDVSSVNKETKEIEGAAVLLGKDSPSRARKLVRVNDVIFATVRPTHSRVALITEEYDGQVCSTGYFVLRGKENIENKYLFYFLLTDEFNKQMEKLQKGASYPAVTDAEVKSILLRYPKPLPEQQRIVSILDESFSAIERSRNNAEQNLKNAKELFESYLQGVFDPSTRSGKGKKGDGWEEKTIGDLGSPKMCKRIFKEQTTAVGDIPFYKIGTFGKEPDAFISRAIYDEFRAKYSFPKKGDVLISASGTIGRRVRYDGEPAYFQDSNIVWIENDEKQVSNDFLYEFYGACNWGSTKGATISRLYNDNLKSIKISFPKSLKEQQTIVRQLDALRAETQKLEAVYKKKMADLEELKKSILQKAFVGELMSEPLIKAD